MDGVVQRDVAVKGTRIRVAEHGNGEPVLLIHGFFMDHTTWLPLFEKLGNYHHLVAPDLPGFGMSEKPSPGRFAYSVDAFTETVADLYAGLNLGTSNVIGQGLGGAIALALAARHPELVSRLVVVNPLYEPTRVRQHANLVAPPLIGGLALRQIWGKGLFRQYFTRFMASSAGAIPRERIDYYYETFNSPSARNSALATIRGTHDTRALTALLGRIRSNTLVVWGQHDRVQPPQWGQKLVRDVRRAELSILNTGPCPQEEAAQDFSKLVRTFFARVEG